MLNINEFPLEIISKIISFLRVWDRRNAVLVCKKWRDATKYTSFYNCALFRGQKSIGKARLLWTQRAYHPFSEIEFQVIKEFPDDFSDIWDDLGRSVSTLSFSQCNGLNAEVLQNMLDHMPKVQTIDLVCNEICPRGLERKVASVTALKLSVGECPVQNIWDLSESFPNLKDLYIQNRWNLDYLAEEGYVQTDPNEVVVGTAFEHWLKKFANSCTARITINPFGWCVEVTEPFLMELRDIPNVDICDIGVSINAENRHELHNLLRNKGSGLSKLSIVGAQILQWPDYGLIHRYCTNLRSLGLTFECDTPMSPCYPFDFLADFQSLTSISISFDDIPEIHFEEFRYHQTRQGFPNIKRLSLLGVQIIPYNSQFKLLLEDLPNLEELSLYRCKIDRDNFETIVAQCPNLRELDLTAVTDVPDDVFVPGCFNDLRKLEALSFTCHPEMTHTTIENLGSLSLPILKSISFDHLGELPPNVVLEICKSCPDLEKMYFTEFTGTKQDYEEIKSLLPLEWKNIITSEVDIAAYDGELCLQKF